MEIKNGIIIDDIAYECMRGEGENVSLRRIGKLKDVLIPEHKHDAIDLGLSVKWADCNVGAKKPSDYGYHYAWGEIEPKSEYTEENSVTVRKSIRYIAGNPTYDAARANWGSPWRLPTMEEIEELVSKCKWEWTNQGGHKGYKITGPNGNNIFLPAVGWRDGTSLSYAGESGHYWGTKRNCFSASDIIFRGGNFYQIRDSRCYLGQSVRPVTE